MCARYFFLCFACFFLVVMHKFHNFSKTYFLYVFIHKYAVLLSQLGFVLCSKSFFAELLKDFLCAIFRKKMYYMVTSLRGAEYNEQQSISCILKEPQKYLVGSILREKVFFSFLV